MFESCRVHTRVHLKFLARSRVVAGFCVLVLLVSSLGLVPAVLGGTASHHFDLLMILAQMLHGIAALLTSGLGMVVLWSHRRSRTVKMVATTPSSFEGWVASVFVAPLLVGVTGHAVIAAVIYAVSRSWGLQYEIGFLYLAAEWIVESAVILAFLTALSVRWHPILATVAMVFFNEWTFGWVRTLLGGAAEAHGGSVLLRGAQGAAAILYYVAPTFSPFAAEMRTVNETLRVAAIDWRYLAAGVGYAALCCAFGYLATLWALRRQPLI